jgi:chorismate--pyruvate lyase
VFTTASEGLLPSPHPLWQAAHRDVLEGNSSPATGVGLTGPWRLLLLGDGSPTRHLQTLSGVPVEIELIAMAAEPSCPQGGRPPEEISELAEPLLRRQVWLRCGAETLAWAESWWNLHQAELHLRQRDQPIWRSLTSERAELFREVDGLALVEAPWLAERFGHGGPFWARHYRFFRGGHPFTVIREVFSPTISRWLGPSTSPVSATPAVANSSSPRLGLASRSSHWEEAS